MNTRRHILREVLQGLAELHAPDILHNGTLLFLKRGGQLVTGAYRRRERLSRAAY
ncbi:hypothetical protein BJX68DRAFT_144192 [Aspergillus pseudodeflectus]|uniref:Protein kinase domain-containing protein n=1 Tax=Aspergillus pseudodeflectus TaxID=176178 RepID=A0ABR4L339_9EURO